LAPTLAVKSGAFIVDRPETSQPEYDLFNASLEYRPTENFGIELWGRNLFDEQYAVQKIASSGISVNTSLGAPRTYGVNFKVRY
jgi:iron complex outermembrane recepter protein